MRQQEALHGNKMKGCQKDLTRNTSVKSVVFKLWEGCLAGGVQAKFGWAQARRQMAPRGQPGIILKTQHGCLGP